MSARTMHAARGRRQERRGGFTIVELLVVVSILGIVAGLAIPNMRTVITKTRATEIVADVDVVRVAVMQAHANTLVWPEETGTGVVPPELEGFLPEGFTFQRDGYELDYEQLPLPGGLPGDPSVTLLIGVAVTTESAELGNALAELLGGSILFSAGNTHTVVIDRM